MSAPLRIERADATPRVVRVVLDRPPLQILDLEFLAALDAAFAELARTPALQLVFLEGSTEKAFSAGVSVQDHTPDKIERMLLSFHGGIAKLRSLDALTVALVDGHCLGGGLELARACDLVVATERAKFGQPEILLGCFPPVAAALYPRRIGFGATLELLLSGRTIEAAEAWKMGLIDALVPVGGLAAKREELVAMMAPKSAAVTRLAKRAVRAGVERGGDDAIAEAERIYLRDLAATKDMREGLDAFLAKRTAVWKHE